MRGRSLKKALKSNDLPAEFGAWTAIAKSRMQLRAVVHAKETRSSPPRYEAPPPPIATATPRTPTVYFCDRPSMCCSARPDFGLEKEHTVGHATCSVLRPAL
jgi:hypothetical protein